MVATTATPWCRVTKGPSKSCRPTLGYAGPGAIPALRYPGVDLTETRAFRYHPTRSRGVDGTRDRRQGNRLMGDRTSRRCSLFPLLTLLAGIFVLSLGARAADAAVDLPEFVTEFGEYGSGAGQLAQGNGIATDPVTGHVFVAEDSLGTGARNARVSEFSVWGNFIRAWGWGVADGSNELQSCISSCQRGVGGSGVGQFESPNGIAVDSSGDIYVFDLRNLRVQKFNSDGEFLLMFGGGVNQGPNHPGNLCTAANVLEGDTCGAGTAGTAPGQFSVENLTTTYGNYVAVGPEDHIFVGDKGRIQEFDSAGNHLSSISLPSSGYEGAGAKILDFSPSIRSVGISTLRSIQLLPLESPGNPASIGSTRPATHWANSTLSFRRVSRPTQAAICLRSKGAIRVWKASMGRMRLPRWSVFRPTAP